MPKDGKEAFVRRKKAARRDGRRGGKGQGSKEADGRIKERKYVGGPGNIGGRVRASSWVEENMVTKFDVLRSSGSERMP